MKLHAFCKCGLLRFTVIRLLLFSVLLSSVTIIYTLHVRPAASIQAETETDAHLCKRASNSHHNDNASSIPNLLTPGGVPMILHFVYKDTNILEAYRTGIETCINLNTNWTVVLWTDDSVKSFISREYPQYESVFYGFPHKIQRSDAVRYLILYTFGGVYIDLDMMCRQPLLASLSNIPCFLDREREHQTQYVHGRQYSAMNSAMGCKPRHPFFGKLVETVFKQRISGAFHFPETIFITTGPGMLTRMYEEWVRSKSPSPVTLLTESYFSPHVNPRSGLYPVCRSMMAAISRRGPAQTVRESACLAVHKLGYEASDATFVSNLTVAIHQFTHLGYHDQNSRGFDALKQFPGIVTYASICQRIAN